MSRWSSFFKPFLAESNDGFSDALTRIFQERAHKAEAAQQAEADKQAQAKVMPFIHRRDNVTLLVK